MIQDITIIFIIIVGHIHKKQIGNSRRHRHYVMVDILFLKALVEYTDAVFGVKIVQAHPGAHTWHASFHDEL